MPPPPKCRWTDRQGNEHECPHDPTHDNNTHCIFHAKEKDPREFRNALARLIRQWRNEKAKTWDFSGFIFVDAEPPGYVPSQRFNLFNCAVFPCSTTFASAVFEVGAKFRRCAFRKHAEFRLAEFCHWADFELSVFNAGGDFQSASFRGVAHMQSASFGESTTFALARFELDAYFDLAAFAADLLFRGAKFTGQVRFRGLIAPGVADFNDSSFGGLADFSRSEFRGPTFFKSASFKAFADFREVQIAGRFEFWETMVERALTLEGALISGAFVRFRGMSVSSEQVMQFRNMLVGKDSGLYVHSCDMARALLRQTDCGRINFLNCLWPKARNGRTVVYDELDALARGHLSRRLLRPCCGSMGEVANEIGITYQQLARNFRDCHNHQLANEFDRGVFEMRRLAARAWGGFSGWANYTLISVYKYLSHYSGNMILPVFWMAVSILIFGWVYSMCVAPHGLTWPWGSVDWGYHGSIYTETLKVIAFGRPDMELLSDVGFWVELLKLIQRALTATLITLFIFAVRRRFKH